MTGQQVEHLLEWHDGDDRCRCLRSALLYVLTVKGDAPEVRSHVAASLARCLELHPAGQRWREETLSPLGESDLEQDAGLDPDDE